MKILDSFVASVAIAATTVACGHAQSGRGSSDPWSAQVDSTGNASACPMRAQDGVQATVTELPDGVAVAFSGAARHLGQLRTRVRAMDRANTSQGDPFAACPCIIESAAAASAPILSYGVGHDGYMIDGDPGTPESAAIRAQSRTSEQAVQAMGAVPAATSVDDTPTGGVVRFTAMDPSQVQALRDEVQENVRSMERGCAGVP